MVRIYLSTSILLCFLVFLAVTGYTAEPPGTGVAAPHSAGSPGDRATASPPVSDGGAPAKRRAVLIIYTFSGQTPWERHVRNALHQQLDELAATEHLDIFEECLDLVRLRPPKADDYLSAKYRSLSFNMVIADGGGACNFLSRHPALFTGAARCYFANTAVLAPIAAGTTVYSAEVDSRIVLQTMMTVLPEIRRIVVVTDRTPNRRTLVESLMETASRYAGRVRVELWDGFSVAELYEKAAKLTSDSAILYAGIFRDQMGELQTPSVVGERLSSFASVPVFGVADTFVTGTVLGGYVVSAEKEGRLMGRVIAERGNRPPQLTRGELTAALTEYLFDDRQLKRWGIPDQRLPKGSIIINRKTTLWDEYRWHILGVLALCTLQTILIVVMVTQRSLRRKAEIQVQRQKDQLAHVTRVNMMGELSASFAHELKQPLAAIRINVQTARSMLAEGDGNLSEVREILEDINADNQRADEVIRRLRAFFTKGKQTREYFDLNHLIQEMADMLASEASVHGVGVKLCLASSLPAMMGDSVQIRQVLLNLMMNALESLQTVEQTARLITVTSAPEAGDVIRVLVADTGPGIPDDCYEDIFSSFHTTKSGGMGMGLTISRAIIEAHGGRLTAERKQTRGATFSFTLPAPVKDGNGYAR